MSNTNKQFVLLSLCNLAVMTTSPLVCVQFPDDLKDGLISFAPVSLGYPDLIFTSTGLTSFKGKIFVLFLPRGGPYHIAALNEDDLWPLYYQKLPEVKDGHSILAFDNYLYVVSTGTDEIICYEIKEKSLENPKVVWQASDKKTDTHHINSIAERNGEILISAFGPKSGQLWTSSSNGYIYNITTNSSVASGIHHPHSISVNNGNIYYSNSHRNSFCVVGQTTSIFDLDGYTRGVSWLSNDLACVATSIGRKISKSTGLIANPADPGESAGKCSLFVGKVLENKIIREVDVSSFGTEIYDILTLQGHQYDLLTLSNNSQKVGQQVIHSLLPQLQRSDQQIAEYNQQIAEYNQQIAEYNQQIAEYNKRISERDQQIALLTKELSSIKSTHSWNIYISFISFFHRLFPQNSLRRRILNKFLPFILPSKD